MSILRSTHWGHAALPINPRMAKSGTKGLLEEATYSLCLKRHETVSMEDKDVECNRSGIYPRTHGHDNNLAFPYEAPARTLSPTPGWALYA